ncbi:MAG: MFS transporter [Candidatus ainarchaeum sp.]|nr:MFS transporter [Candidatus ainarchaeum sp.]
MQEKQHKKTLATFSIASFLNDFGAYMIYPIWPLFVTGFFGANMVTLGFLDGLGDSLVSISQAVSGYLSDRWKKRKIFIWLGYLFGALSRIGYAASISWQQLIPFRILDRSGKIRDAPRDAIVADISTEQNRGKNFGILRAMDKLGGVCGIIACIILFAVLGYQELFLLAAVPSFIGAVLILHFIKEKKHKAETAPEKTKTEKFYFKKIGKNFKLFILLNSVFALGSFSYSFLLIFAKEAGIPIIFIPALYLFYMGFASLSSIPFGKMADKIGRKPVIMISFILWLLVCISFVTTQAFAAIILAFIAFGLQEGALNPVQRAFVSELCPKEFRASSLGFFEMATGLCALPSSIIAGLLWDTTSKFVPFYLSIGLTIIAIAMLFFVKEKPRAE